MICLSPNRPWQQYVRQEDCSKIGNLCHLIAMPINCPPERICTESRYLFPLSVCSQQNTWHFRHHQTLLIVVRKFFFDYRLHLWVGPIVLYCYEILRVQCISVHPEGHVAARTLEVPNNTAWNSIKPALSQQKVESSNHHCMSQKVKLNASAKVGELHILLNSQSEVSLICTKAGTLPWPRPGIKGRTHHRGRNSRDDQKALFASKKFPGKELRVLGGLRYTLVKALLKPKGEPRPDQGIPFNNSALNAFECCQLSMICTVVLVMLERSWTINLKV